MENQKTNNEAGKGDSPRSCFSQQYRENYNLINWNKKNEDEDYSVCYDKNGVEIKNND